ncbi:DUF5996 family protein [Saccharopolyspora sp. NFXS83]|uniref:DUF5996 family protein n=1 Tax=Saccharopolyspora sp. NFXS83 TaxID=2993560 RepID=UPI00224B83F1|nr:DUF5996 family protein [Saccharopolyspora sp. NFXS83]MCX2729919.1 DUF5996 family protein [Saccharopolyspora sp. NFXS83]
MTGRVQEAVGWPRLRVDEWADTRETLQLWTQIVGKVRLALAPMMNHWWQVALYVSPRGLTTSAVPHGSGNFDAEFDFCDHVLRIRSADGGQREVVLEPKPVALFYRETMAALDELDLTTSIHAAPNEVAQAIPFDEDTAHASYDAASAHLWWRQLVAANRVFGEFRAEFLGKVSPVHYFWGAMDLAVTRFSGRPAPPHPGGAPNCPDEVMVEGYSHELSSCGFWPGGDGEGLFYSYAYPEPAGFAEHPVRPADAAYFPDLGEFVLPYEAVRTADDPDAMLLEFLRSTYAAAAQNGDWDRTLLEVDPSRLPSPR